MRHFPDSFALLPDAQVLCQQLITHEPEFAHLRRARLGCLGTQRAILDRGAVCRALVVKPAQLSGKQIERSFHEWALAQLFAPLYAGELPDYVVFFDVALWQHAAPLEREQLCYHELSHVKQKHDEWHAPKFERDGQPALTLVAHDAELFYSELRRYGPVVPAYEDTACAIADSSHLRTRRRLKAV